MNYANIVVPYDSNWPARFRVLRSQIDSALDAVEHETQHVGSTAVPGLAAKPIIDIDVTVVSAPLVKRAIEALAKAGYHHEGDGGIKGREQFGNPPGIHDLHLYVVVAGSLPHRDHVDLRDYLRRNPADAKHYGDLKARLAPWLSVDRERYFEGKRQLVDELLDRARVSKTDDLWRSACGGGRQPPL